MTGRVDAPQLALFPLIGPIVQGAGRVVGVALHALTEHGRPVVIGCVETLDAPQQCLLMDNLQVRPVSGRERGAMRAACDASY